MFTIVNDDDQFREFQISTENYEKLSAMASFLIRSGKATFRVDQRDGVVTFTYIDRATQKPFCYFHTHTTRKPIGEKYYVDVKASK